MQVIHLESNANLPCLNKSCIHIASNILDSMDLSIDPCDDFYSYSCNGWIKSNPIPDGKSQWGTFMKLEQQNQLVIKRVLGKYIQVITYNKQCLKIKKTYVIFD